MLPPPGTSTDLAAANAAEARYEGGERLLELALPPNRLLPGLTLGDVIAEGVKACLPRMLPLMGPDEVFRDLEAALGSGKALSVVRLGDGELLTLAQGCVMSTEEAAARGPYLPYAGVNVPDLEARDRLADAVRRADIIGVPVSRRANYQPLLFEVMRAHGVDLQSKKLTISTINFRLFEDGLLARLMRGRRVLVAGNSAPGMAEALEAAGYAVSGVVSPVRGMGDIDGTMAEIARHEFDLALVAAGIPAVVLSVSIASTLGRTAVDFGHMANEIADGRADLG